MADAIIPEVSNPQRLAALENTDLLDSPPEAAFDRLTVLATKILGAPVVLVSLVDKDRQFFKSEVGLPEPWAQARATPLPHSFCKHVVAMGEPLIVADARQNPLTRDNLAISALGVVAYAGIPLTTADGHSLGSFCAIDNKAHPWTDGEIQILKDLAAFTMTEIELRLAARRLKQSYAQLQNLEALRDDLTHMIVHDLRTPLALLLLGVETMELLGELNESQQNCMDISVKSGKVLLHIVNDLLDISKMESGFLQLELKEVTAEKLVETARQQVEAMTSNRDLTFVAKIDSAMPSFAADEEKLVRTLVNLIGNAIKFTPPGGTVTVSVRSTKTAVEFAVSDTGEGIPARALDRIFKKFEQAESRRASRSMSTGLGLTFCRMVVEAHGGHIRVESTPGEGSTFCFTIPQRAG